MPHIDPTLRFWIGIFVTTAICITSGTLVLTDAIPEYLIKPVTAWCGVISVVGSSFLTALNGLASTNQSRLASAAAIPEVKAIITTSPAMADAAGPKVIAQ
jgi:hypothetical protein